MRKYHHHPDDVIIIIENNKVYAEKPHLAKFDIGKSVPLLPEGCTEIQYVTGYGAKYFNKGDMVSFNNQPVPALDELIDNIDNLIAKKKIRESLDPKVWEIPEDMKEYKPKDTDEGSSSSTLNDL